MALFVGLFGSCLTSSSARAQTYTTRGFWISGAHGWSRVTCRLVGAGPHVRVYAAAGASVSPGLGRAISARFEGHILPTDLRLFGTPRNLGTVNLLLLPLSAPVLGFFDESDLVPPHPRGDVIHSNGGNVLYIRPPQAMPDADKMSDFYEVVAHELQHLLDFRLRVMDRHYDSEALWLNEGLSFYAQLANGYWTPRDRIKVVAASDDPGWQLPALGQRDPAFARYARVAYGRAGLFVCYLASRFGAAFIRQLVINRAGGLEGVDRLLRARGQDVRQVFADWAVALYLNRGNGGPFGHLLHGFHSTPRLSAPPVTDYPFDSLAPGARHLRLTAWSNSYLRFAASRVGSLHLGVQGRLDRLKAAVVLQDSDNPTRMQIHWLQPSGSNRVSADASGFGRTYDQATVVLSGVTTPYAECTAQTPDAVRVTATLVHVGNDEGVARRALSARHHAHLTVRQVRHLDQLLAVRPLNPEAARVPARDAQWSQVPCHG